MTPLSHQTSTRLVHPLGKVHAYAPAQTRSHADIKGAGDSSSQPTTRTQTTTTAKGKVATTRTHTCRAEMSQRTSKPRERRPRVTVHEKAPAAPR